MPKTATSVDEPEWNDEHRNKDNEEHQTMNEVASNGMRITYDTREGNKTGEKADEGNPTAPTVLRCVFAHGARWGLTVPSAESTCPSS